MVYDIFLGKLGSGGLKVGDVIQVGGIHFKASNKDDIQSKEFNVEHSGSIATAIDLAARSLVDVVNGQNDPNLRAEYKSCELTLPGQIKFIDNGEFALSINSITVLVK